MTLIIHKLNTQCRAPRRFERIGQLVNETAKGPLRREIEAHVGPSLDRLPPVVRLRELRVSVKVPGRKLTPELLADGWAAAFTHAVHRALAHPDGDGTFSLRRYESELAYKAALLYEAAMHGGISGWQFPELEKWLRASPQSPELAFLLSDPVSTAGILLELARTKRLEFVLRQWTELQLEQLLHTLGECERGPGALTWKDLVEIGRAVVAIGRFLGYSFAARHQALRTWAHLGGRFSARAIWHGLRLVLKLLEEPGLWQAAMHGEVSALKSGTIPFPAWCEQLLLEAASQVGQSGRSPEGTAAAEIAGILAQLLRDTPSAATPGHAATWIHSECAGLLLLLPIARRLGFGELSREPEMQRFGAGSALSFLLAGTAATLLGRQLDTPLDPTAALFAGIFAEPDHAALKRFFGEADVSGVKKIAPAGSWPEALEVLARKLTNAFGARIRGFRSAPHESVLKLFVRVPGRVLVEKRRMLVVLEPTPWSVALHISGADDAVERIEWLAGRRLEFVLEGL